LNRNPFLLFFPIGWVLALWAATEWMLFAFVLPERYPGQLHADIMFGGFLLSFVTGFLMTAIPRFTESQFATTAEIAASAAASIGSMLALAFHDRAVFLCGVLTSLMLLLRFAFRRFGQRKSNPPYSFVLVGIGLALGMGGFGLQLGLEMGWVTNPALAATSRSLTYQGMMLALLLGFGSRLLPGIFGWSEVVAGQRAIYEGQADFFRIIPLRILLLSFVFVLSFAVESIAAPFIGKLMRAAVVGWIALGYWRIHQLPKTKTPHTRILWLSCATSTPLVASI
jgi:hypothetical protein